jgi:hypothetical protein
MTIYKGGKVAADQTASEVVATPLKRGPKAKLVGGARKQVYLDNDTIEGAMKLGGGELSAGLREAVKIAVGSGNADRRGERRPNKGKE